MLIVATITAAPARDPAIAPIRTVLLGSLVEEDDDGADGLSLQKEQANLRERDSNQQTEVRT